MTHGAVSMKMAEGMAEGQRTFHERYEKSTRRFL